LSFDISFILSIITNVLQSLQHLPLFIGCGVVTNRLSRHRLVFLNGGRDVPNPGGTTNGSATGGHMYKYDTHRKNWMFSWCDIGNKSLAEEYEDLLIKLEKPLFNKEWMGGK